MATKLTKDQRYTVYVLLLQEVKKQMAIRHHCYMCLLLKNNIIGELKRFDFKLLTELYSYKPKRMDFNGGWFGSGDYQKRIDILKQCIKETENF